MAVALARDAPALVAPGNNGQRDVVLRDDGRRRGVAALEGSEQVKDGLGEALVLEGLRRFYGDVVAVDDVSLAVAPGEFLTLLGPSGSGKTTTLKMIAGFEFPDLGAIRLGKLDITLADPEQRGIGMVFQNYALFPHMTVSENIAFPLRMRRVPRAEIDARVRDALAMVRLEGMARRRPAQLSGGQQQRVALARALVFRPPLLLMDEPLGALDRQLRKSVQQELKRITRDLGITVVFVTHDQDEALYLSDRIAVMDRGRIVQVGSPEELYAAPGSRFVARFLGESNFLDGQIEENGPEHAVLRLADGTRITGRPANPLAPGMAGAAMVRPEAVLPLPEAAQSDGANRVAARVTSVEFIGHAREYTLEAAGSTFVAHVPVRAGGPAFVPGERVAIGFGSDDCLIFGGAE